MWTTRPIRAWPGDHPEAPWRSTRPSPVHLGAFVTTAPRVYTDHMLVVIGGDWVGEASDGWECTVRVSSNGGGGGVLDEEAYLNDIVPNLKTWFGALTNQMSNQANLKYVKVNRIGTDGKYVDKTNKIGRASCRERV